MTRVNQNTKNLVLCFLVSIFLFPLNTFTEETSENDSLAPFIKNIMVKGSKTFPDVTIKSKIPYHVGERFWADKSNQAILNLYKLGYFKQIEIKTEKITKNSINLYVVLTEKPALQDVVLVGNKHVSKKEINKKIDFEKIPAAEEQELKKLARIIKTIYAEKGYHFPKIETSITEKKGKATATITIDEGVKSVVKRVRFDGNKHFNEKKLRGLLFTREDWLLGPLDRSGSYIPLAVEQDKLTLENFYQSNGYFAARVPEAKVTFSDDKKEIMVTFEIHEGDLYHIGEITAPGNDIYSEKELLSVLLLRKGHVYSREMVRMSIERLRTLWGDKGYIYADVEPTIQPNEETKTIDLGFYSELGDPVTLNRINIFGNEKTRDKVIRRQFLLDEGEQLTTTRLEASKQRIAGLGFFDPKDGVNWKINRIDEERTDIDLMLKEVKTGKFEFKLSYGGSPGNMSSSSAGIAGEIMVTERNLFGKGMIANFNSRIGQEEKSFSAGFAQPWLFDKPIRIGLDGYFSRNEYSDIRKVINTPQERRAGLAGHLGFTSRKLADTTFIAHAGFDSIDMYSRSRDGTTKVKPEASISGDATTKAIEQAILDKQFQSGKFAYLQLDIGQDTRNHHTHITRGYKWDAISRFGVPTFGDNFGFYKIQWDGHYYTPLINETDLVLHMHAHLGYTTAYGDHAIPYRELYHIGGQASVRGWKFSGISPMWYHPNLLEDERWQGDPLGARKAFFFNVELVFPLTEDLSMKGVVFYDGGSGWDTPSPHLIVDPLKIKNNDFDYRHSIGVGLRMLNPQPIRVDWGFKLDKRTGETASEVSFSSYYDF